MVHPYMTGTLTVEWGKGVENKNYK
jgi:hypothetical protein